MPQARKATSGIGKDPAVAVLNVVAGTGDDGGGWCRVTRSGSPSVAAASFASESSSDDGGEEDFRAAVRNSLEDVGWKTVKRGRKKGE